LTVFMSSSAGKSQSLGVQSPSSSPNVRSQCETKASSGSASRRATAFASHSGWSRSSASRQQTYSPRAERTPWLRAAGSPRFAVRSSRARCAGIRSSTASVSGSRDPSSTTTISKSRSVCASTLASASSSVLPRSKHVTTTETRGAIARSIDGWPGTVPEPP
jgi:hypothetical protein